MKDSKPQIQDSQGTPNKTNTNKDMPRHTIVKLLSMSVIKEKPRRLSENN
jgi:hypothetical protein